MKGLDVGENKASIKWIVAAVESCQNHKKTILERKFHG
jgi:hypothetical protein